MKLARPDVRHARVVLAGCVALVEGDGDDDGLREALRTRGIHARWLAWDDPATLDADLVILRATWDYTERLEEFLGWTRRVRHLLNPPAAVAWNADKRYLADLAADGVPVLPSESFAPGEPVVLPDPFPADGVVVKPAVGAGSLGAGRFDDADAARAHAESLQRRGATALVQPYDRRVEAGETALVFLSGRPAHAFTKGPMLPEPGGAAQLDESGTFTTERLSRAEPSEPMWDAGMAALAAAAARVRVPVEELLYARVDLIGGDPYCAVLEVELIEPSLGWRQTEPAERARGLRSFALGVESALERLDLGPLSRRRP